MERIRELRKALGLSQDAFAKRLGVTGTAVSRYEKGERSLTEQMALSICREFRVNYYWLTEGQGEMFVAMPDSAIDEIVDEYDLDEDDEKMLRKWLELPADLRKIIKDYLRSIFT